MPRIKQKVDSIINVHDKNHDQSEIIKIAHDFSIKYYNQYSYEEAVIYAEKEVSIYEKLEIKNKKYAKALYNLALFYSKQNAYKKSFSYHKKVIAIDKDVFSTAKSFCGIGQYYEQLGDFFKSKDFYSRGTYLLEKLDKKQLLVRKYLDFSQVLGEIDTENSLDLQIEVLDKVKKLFREAPSNEFFGLRNYFRMNNGYANYYNSYARFNFHKAKGYYHKNLKEAIEYQDSSVVMTSYTNLGNLYIESKNEIQKDSALYFLNSGLKYCIDKKEEADVYHNLSNYYLEKKEYLKALDHIQQSLIRNVHIDRDILSTLNFKDLSISDDKDIVLSALIQKATIFIALYKKEKNKKYSKLALTNLLLADELVNILLKDSVEEGSRLYWREKASEIYLKGIVVCKILKEYEKAFYFSEKKKALVLIEDILANTEKIQLPDKVVENENELKKRILSIENDIKNEKDHDSLEFLENKRFILKQRYQRLEDSLRILFPEYYKNKESIRILNLKNVQKTLDTNRIIISYVSNQDENDSSYSELYAVFISKTQTEILRIGTLSVVEKLVKDYRFQLSKPFETEQDRLDFQNVAAELYTLLIPRNKIAIPLHQKDLIIIPDGVLQYIPFESLIVDKNTNRYLIEDNEISYAYSMSFLQHNATVNRISSKDLVSFAPVNFDHNNLDDIGNSIKEIAGITQSIIGDSYSYEDASKHNFLSKTDDYKIIHLATHANFTKNLQIAFHNSNLESHELYTSKNNAELVVLSACNTSLGEIAEGEGVMSLARGFFYAGANTVISSLWNANDKATAQIMESFYSNLDEGQTKSKALHHAKINYIESTSFSDASPHYWATFILIGDAETELFPPSIIKHVILFSLFLVLLISVLFFFFKKR